MTPQREIEAIREMLNSDNLEFLKDVVAFRVASRIVKYRDPELINSMPEWIFDLVHEMRQAFERDGSYVIVSNLGIADHSAMVRELVDLMKFDKRKLN